MQEDEHNQHRQQRTQQKRHFDIVEVAVNGFRLVGRNREFDVRRQDFAKLFELVFDPCHGGKRVAVSGFQYVDPDGRLAVQERILGLLRASVQHRRDVAKRDDLVRCR